MASIFNKLKTYADTASKFQLTALDLFSEILESIQNITGSKYKTYATILSGATTPIDAEVVNDTVFTVQWTRSGTGVLLGTVTGTLPTKFTYTCHIIDETLDSGQPVFCYISYAENVFKVTLYAGNLTPVDLDNKISLEVIITTY